jgi:hypothetical protein
MEVTRQVSKRRSRLSKNALLVLQERSEKVWGRKIGDGVGDEDIYMLPIWPECARQLHLYLKQRDALINNGIYVIFGVTCLRGDFMTASSEV